MKTVYTNIRTWRTTVLTVCAAFALLCCTSVSAQTVFGPTASAITPGTAIPDDTYNGSPASMLQDDIVVAGVTGATVTDISVDIQITHTWVGDLTLKLVSPDGDTLTLVSRPGEAETVDDGTECCGTNADWASEVATFSDFGATDAEDLGLAPFGSTDYFPNPGITAYPTQTFASLFGGTMNGTWSLFAGDAVGGDAGTLDAWSITITTASPSIDFYKTVALENGNGDCADDPEPLLTATTLEVNAGDNVCYFYTAFNDGDVAFGLHNLDDDVEGSLNAALVWDLQPAAGVVTRYGPITINGSVANVGTWEAYNVDPTDGVSGTASAIVTVAGAAPVNDNVCDALPLTAGLVLNLGGSSANATTEVGEPVPPLGDVAGAGANSCETPAFDGWCGGDLALQNTMWYTFVAPASGSVTINTDGSYDTQLAVYEAASCAAVLSGGATLLAANDDNPSFVFTQFSSSLDVNCLTPGETYFVQVDGFVGASGDLFVELIENPGVAVSGVMSGGGVSCDFGLVDVIYNFTGVGPWDFDVLVDGLNVVSFTGESDGANIPGNGDLLLELLTVTDQGTGCTTDGTGTVVITEATTPTAAYSASQDPASFDVTFTDLSSESPISWAWDFDGDAIADATTQNPTHTYAGPGTYTACLTVTNECGTSVAFCETVLVEQFGCTDPTALNYNPLATLDDGSCILPNCVEAPLNFTYCYDSNADDQFLYIPATPGVNPQIFINAGSFETNFDVLTIYDGTSTADPVLYSGDGDVSGVYVESTSGFLLVQIESDGSVSCFSGSQTTLDYDVYCGVPCDNPDAGTLTADATPVCLTGGTATISATEGTAPSVPTGYEIAYVLTDGDSPNLDILDASLPPAATASFDVTAGGNYIIHTLVFDPADAGTILAETTGVGVATLIGTGAICASLDVAGTGLIAVIAPDAGTLTADATTVCLDAGTATISGSVGTAATVPAGYEIAYVLTDGDSPNLDILDASLPPAATASFDVTASGNYIIHTLVFDPADAGTILAETTGVGVAGLIGAGTICASLDVAGTGLIAVNAPDAGTLTADATPVCLTGGTATISGSVGTAATVPAGYEVAYVLTDGDSPNLDILDASLPPAATASFDVTAEGNYIIHTLVFDPADANTILAETTGVGVAGLIGAGTICASLDVAGTGLIAVEVCTVAPPNDLCGDAIAVVCGETVGGTNVSATNDANIEFCVTDLTAGPGVWYTFAGTGDDVSVTTCNPATDFDTQLGVFSGDCNALVCVGGNDDDADADPACALNGLNRKSTVNFSSELGVNYYFYVVGFGATDEGIFDLTVTCTAPPPTPANDDACDAAPLVLGANTGFTNVGATVEGGEPLPLPTGCGVQDGWCDFESGLDNTIWFTFVGPASGNLVIDTDGSDDDTQIAAYSAVSCQDFASGSAVQLAANDDNPDWVTTQFSSIVFLCGLTPGETYFLQVDGYDGAAGAVVVNLTEATVNADFTSVATGLSVAFTDASTDAVSYAWDFGDGNVSTDASPTHVYAADGPYTVCLTVTDANGCTSEYCEAIQVTDIPTTIAEAVERGMEVYPNPSNGQFVVKVNGVEADVQIVVMDVAGRQVYNEGVTLNNSFRKELNLDVAKGTYLLQIATVEGLVTRKIQIN